jgi:hypothetical protein
VSQLACRLSAAGRPLRYGGLRRTGLALPLRRNGCAAFPSAVALPGARPALPALPCGCRCVAASAPHCGCAARRRARASWAALPNGCRPPFPHRCRRFPQPHCGRAAFRACPPRRVRFLRRLGLWLPLHRFPRAHGCAAVRLRRSAAAPLPLSRRSAAAPPLSRCPAVAPLPCGCAASDPHLKFVGNIVRVSR